MTRKSVKDERTEAKELFLTRAIMLTKPKTTKKNFKNKWKQNKIGLLDEYNKI